MLTSTAVALMDEWEEELKELLPAYPEEYGAPYPFATLQVMGENRAWNICLEVKLLEEGEEERFRAAWRKMLEKGPVCGAPSVLLERAVSLMKEEEGA